MPNDQLRQIIQQEVQRILSQENTASQFRTGQTPFHTHNGIDSNKLPFLNLSDVPNSYSGQAGNVATVNSTETGLEFDASAGGTPGGSDTQIQFNDAGSFGGDANFTWDRSTSGGLVVTAYDGAGGLSGGQINLTGGNGAPSGGSAKGGDINVTGGVGGAGGSATSDKGGGINIVGGQGGSIGGYGGLVTILGGSPQEDNGGSVNIGGSNAVGTNHSGGTVDITSGTGTGSGSGGAVDITAGDGGASDGSGGHIALTGGAGGGAGQGGALNLNAGAADATGPGGNVGIFAGAGGGTSGNGGSITVTAGQGYIGGGVTIVAGEGTVDAGGYISLTPGDGPATKGAVIIQDPTEAFGQSTRAVGTVSTTDGSYHVAPDFVTVLNNACGGYIRARVVGHRTGGTGGTADDIFITEIVQGVKSSGTTSLVGGITYVFFYQSVVNTDAKFVVSGSNIQLQVRGDVNNNYKWHYELFFIQVSTS